MKTHHPMMQSLALLALPSTLNPLDWGNTSSLSEWQTCLPVPKRRHAGALQRLAFYFVILYSAFCFLSSTVHAQLDPSNSVPFTYQGRLNDGGSPANGSYNFTFTLYTADGNAIAGPVTNNAVAVSNGLFTAQVNFPDSIYGEYGPGGGVTNTWTFLEIAVETNGGSSFTMLAPRQQLTPVPFAYFAEASSNLLGTLPASQLSGTIANANLPASPTFSGTVTASQFNGNLNGNAATATSASSYGGAIALSQLTPAGAVVTNNEPSVTFSNLSLTGALIMPASAVAPFVTIYEGAPQNGPVQVFRSDNGGNIFVGYQAGTLTSAGNNNAALGSGALQDLNNGLDNVAVGSQALHKNSNGARNTAAGVNALANNQSGGDNTALGFQALGNGGGNYNTAVGENALLVNTGNQNTAVGYQALLQNNVVGSSGNNTAIGFYALGQNTSGIYNTAGGAFALFSAGSASGSYNTAFGVQTLYENNAGNNNVALGYQALFDNTLGSTNVGIGAGALYGNTGGNNNVGFGSQTLFKNAYGNANVAVGPQSLFFLGIGGVSASGTNNIAIGFQAGTNLTIGSSNIYIGSVGGATNENNTIRLGTPGVQTVTYIAGTLTGDGGGLSNLNVTAVGSLSNGVALGAGSSNSIAGGVSDAFIGGGLSNSITGGNYATIGGGDNNAVNGNEATIAGGTSNIINAADGTIGGGLGNQIQTSYGTYSLIGGGQANWIYGSSAQPCPNAVIVGGSSNSIDYACEGAFVGGGEMNKIFIGSYCVIAGGQANFCGDYGLAGFIGGGIGNQNWGVAAVIAGGVTNSNYGYYTVIGGGGQNFAQASYGTIAGGQKNFINDLGEGGATISGGTGNTVAADGATIGGGATNSIPGGSYATIGGGVNNLVSGIGSVIGGGGYDGTTFSGNTNAGNAAAIVGGLGNLIQSGANYAVIGGGQSNTNAGNFAAIVGGLGNQIQSGADYSFIGGGVSNIIIGNYATVAGGEANTASGSSFIGGGYRNIAEGPWCTVPGGFENVAYSDASFAAGQYAHAYHNNTFVWSDGSQNPFQSTANDQFLILATGGVGINTASPVGALDVEGTNDSGSIFSPMALIQNNDTGNNAAPALRVSANGNTANGALNVSANGTGLIAQFGNAVSFVADIQTNGTIDCVALNQTSDRNAKENFAPVSPAEMLAKVAALPITAWNYKIAQGIRHVGPTAQDFYAAFNVGSDDKHIATVDEGGVALVAIQGLNEKLEGRSQKAEGQMEQLKAENAELKAKVADLQGQLEGLQKAVARIAGKPAGSLALNAQQQETK